MEHDSRWKSYGGEQKSMYVDYKKLLDKIRQNNLTIMHVLAKAGITYNVITSIKNDKNLSKKTVYRLAAAIGCKAADIVKVSIITKEPIKPIWHEGEETKKEEALWPYASAVICNDVVTSQNLGTLKSMVRDIAMHKRKEVPITLTLPGGVKRVIVFRPDGRQVLKEERSETEC